MTVVRERGAASLGSLHSDTALEANVVKSAELEPAEVDPLPDLGLVEAQSPSATISTFAGVLDFDCFLDFDGGVAFAV